MAGTVEISTIEGVVDLALQLNNPGVQPAGLGPLDAGYVVLAALTNGNPLPMAAALVTLLVGRAFTATKAVNDETRQRYPP